MIAYYPMLKHLHMTLAIVSLLLFVYRWMLSLNASPRLQQRWLKIAPTSTTPSCCCSGCCWLSRCR